MVVVKMEQAAAPILILLNEQENIALSVGEYPVSSGARRIFFLFFAPFYAFIFSEMTSRLVGIQELLS